MHTTTFVHKLKKKLPCSFVCIRALPMAFFCLVFNFSFSQTISTDFTLSEFERVINSSKASERAAKSMSYQDAAGTPFLLEEFSEGTVIMPDSNLYRGVRLRYDIYADKMEFLDKSGQSRELLEPGKYKCFVINDHSFRYVSYQEGNKVSQSFMEIMAEGKVTLYKKINIQLQEAVKPGAYKDAQPPKFVQLSPDLYLAVNGKPAERIKSQKQVVSTLAGQNAGIEAYLKKEKLNLNKEEQLVKAVMFCNQ